MKTTAYICGPRIYKYNGWAFEYNPVTLWPLKKDLSPRARAGDKFYTDIDPWIHMSDEEKEEYRIGGGCEMMETP